MRNWCSVRCRKWAKLGRTQPEQMSSGLSSKEDIARYIRHVSKVPSISEVNFSASCVAIRYLTRLARPGAERGVSPLSIALPFAAIVLVGLISLGGAPSAHWNRMILGDEWLECLLSIPIIAVVPFAVTIF